MKSIFQILVSVFLLICITRDGSHAKASAKLACPLEWLKVSSGDNVEFAAVVTAFGKSHLVARYEDVESGQSVLGRTQLRGDSFVLGDGYFPSTVAAIGQIRNEFEVLTNAHGCKVSWVLQSHPDAKAEYQVAAGEGMAIYVGKGELEERLLAGQVGGGQLVVVGDDESVHVTTDYLVLISTSAGIQISIRDFVFAEDPVFESDLASVEEFHNRVSSEVVQTVQHSRIISQRFTFTAGKEVEVGHSVEVGGYIAGFWFGFEKKEEYAHSDSESELISITHELDTEITITRDIRIPPFQSVQACSRILTSGHFSSNYNAIAEFSIAGWAGAKVKEYVEREHGVEGLRLEDDIVWLPVEGLFSAELALTTEFIVVSLDSEDECHSVQIDVKEWLERSKKRVRLNNYPQPNNLTAILNYWTQ